MSDGPEARGGRRWARLAWGRLRTNRAMLAAGLVALLSIHTVGEGSVVFLSAMMTFLALVSVMTPGRERKRPSSTVGLLPVAPVMRGTESEGQALSAEGLAGAVSDPLIVFDARGLVVYANASASNTFGDLERGISLPLKFRSPEIQSLLERVRQGQPPFGPIDLIERVPIDRFFKVTARAAGDGSGLYVLVFRDMSETRRVDRMRADFIANASHELRTPLASIAGFVETLRGPARNDAKARDRFLEIMQNQTARMARLIDDLLSLSRLEMKTGLAGGARVDLARIIGEVTDSLNPMAVETGVVIDNQIGEGTLEVLGERDELFQVFENLVENACKYGQSGGRVVITRGGAEARDAVVTVRDFGAGIPAEHIPRITERFYRVDVANSRARKGTGLGLSIVKHILTRHRGRLAVESKLGEGSAFTVHLPLAKP